MDLQQVVYKNEKIKPNTNRYNLDKKRLYKHK